MYLMLIYLPFSQLFERNFLFWLFVSSPFLRDGVISSLIVLYVLKLIWLMSVLRYIVIIFLIILILSWMIVFVHVWSLFLLILKLKNLIWIFIFLIIVLLILFVLGKVTVCFFRVVKCSLYFHLLYKNHFEDLLQQY